jgi:hypothetical protein
MMIRTVFTVLFSTLLIFIAAAFATPAAVLAEPAVQKAEQSEHYRCPMHPEQTANEPGKCPKCGMKMEKVPAESSDSSAGEHQHPEGK